MRIKRNKKNKILQLQYPKRGKKKKPYKRNKLIKDEIVKEIRKIRQRCNHTLRMCM